MKKLGRSFVPVACAAGVSAGLIYMSVIVTNLISGVPVNIWHALGAAVALGVVVAGVYVATLLVMRR